MYTKSISYAIIKVWWQCGFGHVLYKYDHFSVNTTPKYYKPLLLVTLQNLMVRPYCQRHHISESQNKEKSSQYQLG